MNFIYKIFCKLDYHFKTSLIEVTIGFGPSGKVEKVQCDICKKVYIRSNRTLKFNQPILIIIILILLILLFII